MSRSGRTCSYQGVLVKEIFYKPLLSLSVLSSFQSFTTRNLLIKKQSSSLKRSRVSLLIFVLAIKSMSKETLFPFIFSRVYSLKILLILFLSTAGPIFLLVLTPILDILLAKSFFRKKNLRYFPLTFLPFL